MVRPVTGSSLHNRVAHVVFAHEKQSAVPNAIEEL